VGIELKAGEGGRSRLLWLIPSSLFFILVPVVTLAAAGHVESALGLLTMSPAPYAYSGLVMIAYGGYYVAESIRVLLVDGGGVPLGDLVPDEQSSSLLVDGIYSRTRNPKLYGYLVALMGLGVLRGSFLAAVAFPLLYLGVWALWLKGREEPALEERFGEEYREYREMTPFLIPRRHRHASETRAT
jgi:protein-S-isoprenylcysteine O-methyltransferase Ste14